MKNYIKVAAALAFTFGIVGCNLDPEVSEYETQQRHEELIANLETQAGVAKAATAKIYTLFQEYSFLRFPGTLYLHYCFGIVVSLARHSP